MAILLDHVLVPSRSPVASAEVFAGILGVAWEAKVGHFTFDGIFARIRSAGIKYRSTPTGTDDLSLNTRMGGRNFYWNDDDGHVWEVLTVSYARQGA